MSYSIGKPIHHLSRVFKRTHTPVKRRDMNKTAALRSVPSPNYTIDVALIFASLFSELHSASDTSRDYHDLCNSPPFYFWGRIGVAILPNMKNLKIMRLVFSTAYVLFWSTL